MKVNVEKRLDMLVPRMKWKANKGTWNGTSLSTTYFENCRHGDKLLGVVAIFTRDVGHHTSGWWKNPDYERCFHLSLSFVDPHSECRLPRDEKLSQRIVERLFGDSHKLLWCEPPCSAEGKKNQVWHYRLFCDEHWRPIKPRGEVYSRELTEAGWKSYSDVRAEMEAIEKMQLERTASR